MDKLIIDPGIGIGNFKLGMNKDDINQCLQEYEANYYSDYRKHLFRDVFMVKYNSEQVVNFIEIPNLKDVFQGVYNDIDLFNTKADDLVKMIDKISPYNRDNEESERGFLYEFPLLGLSLWRGNVLSEEDLNADWSKEIKPDIQEDMIREGMYFESVSVWS
ncbi:hypothetical protein [Pontibacillus marinus]|uniref:Uncharacterized protein n=1 Tax=Pontibacillus marinus BH030004 = DSM 16465 TaxID=1385511 RepID=A0A0A5G254_9BACI|nr:hypothetical protein [Pontibacillus marinus]KGX85223.1 hypothetical protein N783_14965 [Pontibacillus marinus BH030004 = DSM 16465]